MKLRVYILVCISWVVLVVDGSGQSNQMEKRGPLSMREITESLLDDPSTPSIEKGPGQKAIELVRKICDVDFVDDGTNYRILKIAGATDELLNEIDKCRSTERNDLILAGLRRASKDQIYYNQKRSISDFIRLLSTKKNLASRRKFVEAGKEYVKRYDVDDGYGDPGTDELLQYLKSNIQKIDHD